MRPFLTRVLVLVTNNFLTYSEALNLTLRDFKEIELIFEISKIESEKQSKISDKKQLLNTLPKVDINELSPEMREALKKVS